MIVSERMSTTRLWYPNEAPRSVRMTRSLPVEVILAIAWRMSWGARNWPFFTLTAFPVAAAARLQNTKPMARLRLTPKRSTAQPASTCSQSPSP